MPTLPAYPMPPTGPQYKKFEYHSADWNRITISIPYDDGGEDFNYNAPYPPRKITIEYNPDLTVAERAVIDSFRDSVKGRALPFTLTLPAALGGTVLGNVHFGENYESDHVKRQANSLVMELISYYVP